MDFPLAAVERRDELAFLSADRLETREVDGALASAAGLESAGLIRGGVADGVGRAPYM